MELSLRLELQLENPIMALLDHVSTLLDRGEVDHFTLEAGQGETYRHMKPTLYGHGEYGPSSVLAGRPKRIWIENWDSWDEARNAVAALKGLAGKRFTCIEIEGTSHIPMDQMVSHLPDDEDY